VRPVNDEGMMPLPVDWTARSLAVAEVVASRWRARCGGRGRDEDENLLGAVLGPGVKGLQNNYAAAIDLVVHANCLLMSEAISFEILVLS
jgi:hypothetical protein